jgi:PadR family transcriptional regulator PadR
MSPVIFFAMSKGKSDVKKSEVLQGTLDLMILKTLHAIGPLHGFGIARRLTKSGLKQLARETEDWERISGVIGRVLRLAGQKS